MISSESVSALVLAGGEGKRLRVLTTEPSGTAVPKQFCSLGGERSLMEEAIDRGAPLVHRERICAILATEHRRWWSESAALNRLPSANLIMQPRNRGTAVGILYAMLHIAARDPDAAVVLLPSDHHVADETILRQSLVAALEAVRRRRSEAVLLGLEPGNADTELGYIVPGALDPSGGYRVRRFIEKPSVTEARWLIESGALWNMFIIALVAGARPAGSADFSELHLAKNYERLPEVDFSRHGTSACKDRRRVRRNRTAAMNISNGANPT
jgi:mannose-1-phosphate guanylyltransferase